MSEIVFNDASTLRSQMSLDTSVHAASITKALVESVVNTLDSKTGVKATVSEMKESSTELGPKFSVTITHEVPSDWVDSKKHMAEMAYDGIKDSLGNPSNILIMLASEGII